MPDKMQVTTTYLERLAVEQDEAGVEIDKAMAAADGLAYKLVFDHGLISSLFWGVMFGVEKQREAACNNMSAVSTELAANLRTSAAAYTTSDIQSSENLGQQIVPG